MNSGNLGGELRWFRSIREQERVGILMGREVNGLSVEYDSTAQVILPSGKSFFLESDTQLVGIDKVTQ